MNPRRKYANFEMEKQYKDPYLTEADRDVLLREAEFQGKMDALSGATLRDNPFYLGSPLYLAWRNAFRRHKTATTNRHSYSKIAGPLTDPSKLRYQAVFLMGAGGSGKGYVGHKWYKYMPGGSPEGISREQYSEMTEGSGFSNMSYKKRRLRKLRFNKVQDQLDQLGFKIEVSEDPSKVRIPFRLYGWDHDLEREYEIPPKDWKKELPSEIYNEVKGLAGTSVEFGRPKRELPSYWRGINPDTFKEELAGYRPATPGFVHEMSSEMSKAYFQAAAETGDPLVVDITGANYRKMDKWMTLCKQKGYNVSLVLVIVPLTVNQIRNGKRARKVNPMEVVKQWKKIKNNFTTLRSKGLADKTKVIVNRNDAADIKAYKKHKDVIEAHIRNNSKYNSLYELIQEEQPKELTFWGRYITPPLVEDKYTPEYFDRRKQELRSRFRKAKFRY
jgi:predicted kinase